MSDIRSTTSPPRTSATRTRAPSSPDQPIRPVQLEHAVEADRRRSLQADLNAAEERLRLATPADTEPDLQEIVEEVERSGNELLRTLHPVTSRVRLLIDPTHVDEQA